MALAHNCTMLLPISGRGFTTYLRGPLGDNQYGQPHVISQLINLGKVWFSSYPNHPFSIGDISLFGGGPMRGHLSHMTGLDVDIRPLRLDGRNLPINWLNIVYDREMTRNFLRYLRTTCKIRVALFNDRELIRYGLCSPSPNHDNHIHVNFDNFS